MDLRSNGTYSVPMRCDMLVDQGRFIGPDPVGYRCSGEAAWEVASGHLLCQACADILKGPNPERLTFRSEFYGAEYQKAAFKEAERRFLEMNSKPTTPSASRPSDPAR